ncbi:MAG: TlpA family protein disulfide reductase [Actinomycetia bacterium]|nr:TlpA family protein disulfide reductase [Actinomycetes bacterium]
MKIKTIKTIIALLVLCIIAVMLATGCTFIQNIRSLYNGQTDEDVLVANEYENNFTLKDIEGDEISLSDFSTDVIVLNFWATWCPPCRQEIPDFIAAYNKYKDEGVQFIGVSNEDVPTIKDFAGEYGINYLLLVDRNSVIMSDWGVRAIPTTFILNGSGQIMYKNVGMMTGTQLEGAIEDLL